MFWKNKNHCPIKKDDQIWIREILSWINEEMFQLATKETILPTKAYFNHNFTGTQEDADFILTEVAKIFQTQTDNIELGFYSEEPLELARGAVTKTFDGKGSSGMYHQDEHKFYIDVEIQQLNRPSSLISTIAHELSHYVLIGLNQIYEDSEENEWITDLFTIANGFGIFMGNTKFEFNQWQSGDGWGGWQYSIQGYLPQQVIAYAMAEIEIKRSNSIPDWTKFMKEDFKKDFTKGMSYLLNENRAIR